MRESESVELATGAKGELATWNAFVLVFHSCSGS